MNEGKIAHKLPFLQLSEEPVLIQSPEDQKVSLPNILPV